MKERNKDVLAEDFCQSVHDMMVAFGQTEDVGWDEQNLREVKEPEKAVVNLRKDLIWEEFDEFLYASRRGQLVEIADALGDMMVVIAGTAIAYNIDLPAVLAEIQKANLAKIDPDTGKVRKREDGKVLKPVGWKDPNIEAVM